MLRACSIFFSGNGDSCATSSSVGAQTLPPSRRETPTDGATPLSPRLAFTQALAAAPALATSTRRAGHGRGGRVERRT
eukprot:4714589-Alexandrium_andersonii.AAC.1